VTVGYLPAETAGQYQHVLRSRIPVGGAGWCPAKIMGGGARSYGVHLHLADPQTIFPVGDVPPQAVIAVPDVSVAVTGEQRHQDVLVKYAPQSGSKSHVLCHDGHLRDCGGKYAGETAVEVLVSGQRIGQLTRAQSVKYQALLDGMLAAGEVLACEGLVSVDAKGRQVSLRLTRI